MSGLFCLVLNKLSLYICIKIELTTGRSINVWVPAPGPMCAICEKLVGPEMTRDFLSAVPSRIMAGASRGPTWATWAKLVGPEILVRRSSNLKPPGTQLLVWCVGARHGVGRAETGTVRNTSFGLRFSLNGSAWLITKHCTHFTWWSQ